jgi:hypothetical protein
MTTLLYLPPQVMGADGRPVAGAKLDTYTSGTSTPKQTFTDAALTIPHANPIVADAAGRLPAIYLGGGDYRLVLSDAASSVIATYDPVPGDGAASGGAGAAAGAMRNRLLNPAMQISQERGTTSVACTTANTYAIDGWIAALSTTPGGTLTMQQVASITPGGAPHRLRATVTVADGTISAGDYYAIMQHIEGVRSADARFGTSSARQLLLRLGVRSSVSGTFGVSIRNSATNRAWLGTIVVAPAEINTDTVKTLTIPGDVSGTWLTDTGIGLSVGICLAAGTTFQGVAGWQAGNVLATSSQTNLMATGSATFELFDCGLYIDASAAGVLPTWELPDFADELRACQRYWEKSYDLADAPGALTYAGVASAASQSGAINIVSVQFEFRVEKRISITSSQLTIYNPVNGAAGTMSDGAAGIVNAAALGSGQRGLAVNNTGGALAANNVAYAHWAANARL